jgi:hypothetical protein
MRPLCLRSQLPAIGMLVSVGGMAVGVDKIVPAARQLAVLIRIASCKRLLR